MRGTSHERGDLPCQDTHRYTSTPAGLFLAAVAAGAGSAKHAEAGADIAVETAIQFLEAHLKGAEDAADAFPLLRPAFESARCAVMERSCREGVAVREFASTLIVAAASRNSIAVGQIGDGAVVAAGADDSLFSLSTPDSGEFVNETAMLTSADGVDRLGIAIRTGPVQCVSLFTDGLQRLALAMPEAIPHRPFFLPLFRLACSAETRLADTLLSLLSSDRMRQRTDDDMTLVVCAYRGS